MACSCLCSLASLLRYFCCRFATSRKTPIIALTFVPIQSNPGNLRSVSLVFTPDRILHPPGSKQPAFRLLVFTPDRILHPFPRKRRDTQYHTHSHPKWSMPFSSCLNLVVGDTHLPIVLPPSNRGECGTATLCKPVHPPNTTLTGRLSLGRLICVKKRT